MAKRTQHVAPNMLKYVALACCDCLAGTLYVQSRHIQQDKVPTKRHAKATYRNIAGRNMLLASFGHRVVMCCDMLGVVKLRVVGSTELAQVWKWSNLSQQHPARRSKSQDGGQTHLHVAPNNVAICCVGMLRSFSSRFSPPEPIASIKVSHHYVQPTSVIKNLGVTLGSHLTFVPHVNNICRALSCSFHSIGRNRKYLS